MTSIVRARCPGARAHAKTDGGIIYKRIFPPVRYRTGATVIGGEGVCGGGGDGGGGGGDGGRRDNWIGAQECGASLPTTDRPPAVQSSDGGFGFLAMSPAGRRVTPRDWAGTQPVHR